MYSQVCTGGQNTGLFARAWLSVNWRRPVMLSFHPARVLQQHSSFLSSADWLFSFGDSHVTLSATNLSRHGGVSTACEESAKPINWVVTKMYALQLDRRQWKEEIKEGWEINNQYKIFIVWGTELSQSGCWHVRNSESWHVSKRQDLQIFWVKELVLADDRKWTFFLQTFFLSLALSHTQTHTERDREIHQLFSIISLLPAKMAPRPETFLQLNNLPSFCFRLQPGLVAKCHRESDVSCSSDTLTEHTSLLKTYMTFLNGKKT